MEKRSQKKADKESAQTYFIELRFTPYGAKRAEYQRHHAAMEWRDHIIKFHHLTDIPEVGPLPADAIVELIKDKEEEGPTGEFQDSLVSKELLKSGIAAFIQCCTAVTRNDIEPMPIDKLIDVKKTVTECLIRLRKGKWSETQLKTVSSMVCLASLIFDVAAEFTTEDCVLAFEEGQLLLSDQYDSMFDRTRELQALTTTPFMLEVITAILPLLNQQSRSWSEIKSGLVLYFGENIAEDIWVLFNSKVVGEGIALASIETAADEFKPNTLKPEGSLAPHFNIREFADEIVQALFSVKIPVDAPERLRTWTSLDLEKSVGESIDKAMENSAEESNFVRDYGQTLAREIKLAVENWKKQVNHDIGGRTIVDRVLSTCDVNVVNLRNSPEEFKSCGRSELVRRIARSLAAVLRRPLLRKNSIYSSFIEKYTSHGLNKSFENRNCMSPQTIAFESNQFACQLAVYLTQYGKSKLGKTIRSEIFQVDDETTLFFGTSEIIQAARSAAPVMERGGFLGFIHKTIQEYYVAKAIIESIGYILASVGSSTNNEDALRSRLSNSPITKIDLVNESGVVDFLIDFIMDNLAATNFNQLQKHIAADEKLKFIDVKLKAMIKSKLPQRCSRSLLHVASAEGAIHVIRFILDLLKNDSDASKRSVLNMVDAQNKTAVYLATEGGHAEVCKLLIEHHADPSICARLEATLEVLWGDCTRNQLGPIYNCNRLTGQVRTRNEGEEATASNRCVASNYVVGYPMTVDYEPKKCYMYEVEARGGAAVPGTMFFGWTSGYGRSTADGTNDTAHVQSLKHVGYDQNSVGMDLCSCICRMDHAQISWRLSDFLIEASVLNTYGTALDFANNKVHFAVNGNWEMLSVEVNHKLFEDMRQTGRKLFPVLSCEDAGGEVQFNVGQKEFNYPLRRSQDVGAAPLVYPILIASAGISPLLRAAIDKDLDCYNFLDIENGRPIIAETDFVTGNTLIHTLINAYSASGSNEWLDHLKRCTQRGGEDVLNKKNYKGQTPVILTCLTKKGLRDCLELLLVRGADKHAVDNIGKTAFQHAEENNLGECLTVLKKVTTALPEVVDMNVSLGGLTEIFHSGFGTIL